jgi:hypothetical protein
MGGAAFVGRAFHKPTVAVAPLLCVFAVVAGSAIGARAATPFTVTTTLAGKRVLPRRIHWVASTNVAASKVDEVRFFVDGGKPRWVEESAPYTFGDDEGGTHKGYLVTTWLSPGKHRFTVRATALDGRTAESTVVARVGAAHAPPAALAGTWRRVVPDTTAAPGSGTTGNPTDTILPTGTYTMVIDKRWIQVRFPGTFQTPQSDSTGEGWILDSDYTAGPHALRVFGAVTFDTHHGQAELGWWCWPDGPPADYLWSANGDTLTLRPRNGADPCGVRRFVWAGEWKRTS